MTNETNLNQTLTTWSISGEALDVRDFSSTIQMPNGQEASLNIEYEQQHPQIYEMSVSPDIAEIHSSDFVSGSTVALNARSARVHLPAVRVAHPVHRRAQAQQQRVAVGAGVGSRHINALFPISR